MSKSITVEYTRPSDGAQMTKQVTIDIEKYRVDTEEGSKEKFFLKGSASGASDDYIDIEDILANLLDGRPSGEQYAIEKLQTYVDTAFTSGGTDLECTPDPNTLGFVADVPLVILSKYGTVLAYCIPTSIAAGKFVVPAANEGAVGCDVPVGAIVQQLKERVSSLGENSVLGIKAQLEQPAGVTTLAVEDAGSQTIDMTCVASTDSVVAYYDVYVIKDSQLPVPGVAPTTIEPNMVPTLADRTAAQIVDEDGIDEYFHLTTYTLTAIDADDYWVIVVAKDGSGMDNINESALVVSSKLTVA